MKKSIKNKKILERANKIERLLSENNFLLCRNHDIDSSNIKKVSLEMAILQVNKEFNKSI